MFSVKEIVQKLGLPISYIPHKEMLNNFFINHEERHFHFPNRSIVIGDPPSTHVALCRIDSQIKIFCSDIDISKRKDIVDLLLHEACHAIVGKESIDNEDLVMCIQWELMKELLPQEYIMARKEFSMYQYCADSPNYSDTYVIGNSNNDFEETDGWKYYRNICVENGFLNSDYKPIWNLGIHNSFNE